jgi:integrase
MPEYRLCLYRGKFAVTWVDEKHGRQRRSLGTADRSEANRLLVDFEVAQTRAQAKAEPQTIGSLWAAYRKHAEGRPVAVTMGHEEKALKERFFHLPPEGIKDALVDEHINARREQGRSDGTIWTELGHLRIVLSWSVKKGLIDKAPYVKRPKQPAPKRDYLTRDQFNLFLSKCEHPHLRRFVIIAMTTGARASAILDLTWDRVDFERGLIDLSTESENKRKNRPTVPMNRSLRAALAEAKEGSIGRYVVEWAGEKVGSVKKGISAAAKRAKLGFVTPHVLRHSAAVWMAEGGRDMEEIAQYLGHSDSRITARVYARFSPQFLREAANLLELDSIASGPKKSLRS